MTSATIREKGNEMAVENTDLSAFLDMKPTSEDLAWDHALDISASIYARLRELDMSQRDLADAIGVSAGRISQIIKGEPGMSLKTLARIEAALDFDLGSGFRYKPAKNALSDSVNMGRRSFGEKAKARENISRRLVLVGGGLAA